MTTQTTLKPVTRTIQLYGKNGKAQGPTKAYPRSTNVILEGELIKDFGVMSVWKFPAAPNGDPESYFVSYHGPDGQHSGGSGCRTEEEAFRSVDHSIAGREYDAKKRILWREYEAKLAALNEEFKGRI